MGQIPESFPTKVLEGYNQYKNLFIQEGAPSFEYTLQFSAIFKLPWILSFTHKKKEAEGTSPPLLIRQFSVKWWKQVNDHQADKEAVTKYYKSLIQETPKETPSTSTTKAKSVSKLSKSNSELAKKILECDDDEEFARMMNYIRRSPTPSEFVSVLLRNPLWKCMKLALLKNRWCLPTNPLYDVPRKRRNRRRSIQRVEPFSLVETPVVTMADQRTMAELLRAPTEGYAEAIVVPPIPAEHFELKHSLINLYKDVPETSIKLMLFPFSIDGPSPGWLDKEPPHSILTWDDLVSKFINHFFPPSKTTNLRNEISNFHQKFEETFSEAWDRFKDLLRACPHHGFTELHQLDTFYNGLNPSDQDSLNSAAGGNLLERSAQDVLKIIENKSKVRNSRKKPIVSQVKACNVDSSEIASAVSSAVTSAMTAMFKQHQVTPLQLHRKLLRNLCYCGASSFLTDCGPSRPIETLFWAIKTIFKDMFHQPQ
ncbi:reverse transcriptase domain-containing protein [Tanacetum coccineum]